MIQFIQEEFHKSACPKLMTLAGQFVKQRFRSTVKPTSLQNIFSGNVKVEILEGDAYRLTFERNDKQQSVFIELNLDAKNQKLCILDSESEIEINYNGFSEAEKIIDSRYKKLIIA